jgi:hypothetical protein
MAKGRANTALLANRGETTRSGLTEVGYAAAMQLNALNSLRAKGQRRQAMGARRWASVSASVHQKDAPASPEWLNAIR